MEDHDFIRSGMNESEFLGVQHESWRLDLGAGEAADVDRFADEWMTCFGQVNPDLMGASCLQATCDESGSIETLEWFDMRDGDLSFDDVFVFV